MGELVPLPIQNPSPRTLEELVEKAHKLAEKAENVYFDNPHVQLRMHERKVSIRQIIDVLKHGKGIDGPSLDKYGDWRIKLKRFSAGRSVQVVVAVKDNHLEVITVI